MIKAAGGCMGPSQVATAQGITTRWAPKKDGPLPASNPPEISAPKQGLFCSCILDPTRHLFLALAVMLLAQLMRPSRLLDQLSRIRRRRRLVQYNIVPKSWRFCQSHSHAD